MNEALVDLLKNQKKTEYKFEGVDKLQLLEDLLLDIGIHDSHIRDELIYPVLAHLLHDSHFDKEMLVDISKRLISQEFMMFDLDNDIEFSALIRTFTMLQLTILVYVHNRDGLYNKHEFKELFDGLVQYYKLETDLRGFDKRVGFIHSVAHAADTFNQIVKAKEIEEYQLRIIFDIINEKFEVDHYVYTNDEDERTVNVLESMIKSKKLDNDFLLSWIDLVSDYNRPKTYPEVYNININIKSLLRSLYFRFIYDPEYDFLTEKIKEVLNSKVKLR